MGKTLIRLLLQKHSDLGLRCLSRPFWQATTFRIFGVYGAAHGILVFIANLISKSLDKPALTLNLARAFAARMHKVGILMKAL